MADRGALQGLTDRRPGSCRRRPAETYHDEPARHGALSAAGVVAGAGRLGGHPPGVAGPLVEGGVVAGAVEGVPDGALDGVVDGRDLGDGAFGGRTSSWSRFQVPKRASTEIFALLEPWRSFGPNLVWPGSPGPGGSRPARRRRSSPHRDDVPAELVSPAPRPAPASAPGGLLELGHEGPEPAHPTRPPDAGRRVGGHRLRHVGEGLTALDARLGRLRLASVATRMWYTSLPDGQRRSLFCS